nr:MAG TPA_asm: RecX family [Caudoviricetes sp.]
MSTMKKLKNAKDRLTQAEQEVPGAYESGYTGRVNDRLDKINGLNDTGVTDAVLNEAYQSYRDKVAGNAADGAAATLGTAQSLGSGYGTDWTQSVVNQTAQDQTASAGTALAALRSKALQQWQNELAGNTDMVSTLLGQDSMERGAAAQDTANAQSWRNYLYGRVGQARQEGEDAKSNLWNILKGIGSVVLEGYNGYMGYTQQQWENDFREKEMEAKLDQQEKQNRITALNTIQSYMEAGQPDMARAIADVYGVDQGMIDTWSGMTQADRERASALLEMGDLMARGEEKTAGTYGSYYGLLPSMVDSYSEIAGRQNASALELARQKSAITGTSGSSKSSGSRRSSSSGSKTGSSGFTNSQLMSMSKAFKGMASTDPMYSFYKKTLTDAGWLTDSRLEYGQKVVNQSIAGGKSQNEIMNQLMNQGFTDEEIARFFNNAE